jgi:hypothetical protein
MDNPWLEAWGFEDLATVLERRGRTAGARAALQSDTARLEQTDASLVSPLLFRW